MKNIDAKNFLPNLAFVCLGLIWGSNFLYMKLATQYISPIQVVFLRVALAAFPIILFGLVKRVFKKEHLKYWYHFLIMSLLAAVVYYYCFVVGSHLLYSGIAGALSGSSPLFSFVLAAIFLNEEKISFRKVVGLVLGFLGVIILAKPFNTGITANTWQGILYMVIGSISLGASFIYAKKFVSPLKISGVALTSYQLLGATIILCLITPFNGITNIFNNVEAALGLVIGLSLLGTGLAFLIYYFIIDKLGAVKAASVTYIPPIVALIIGAFIGREPIVFSDIMGALIILLGVYILKK
ncbi:DMT family transporter [Flavobacterium sp. xlx-214]|uniref:DMT family transporter n=1 Tax=unclassified Flavobacterium TaxID=196869 RepID=UPI0013D45E8E|nr:MULTISPECIES: DMT family transporter [unclassified Flavobacterium]MBA5791690.1 DMT family transporter [Flavobacterium sp. xlx-221]QMI82933.1 DMT family transporter [Flavobacterium sp. xlx-214]